jgi:hypothetical protein
MFRAAAQRKVKTTLPPRSQMGCCTWAVSHVAQPPDDKDLDIKIDKPKDKAPRAGAAARRPSPPR